MVEEENTPLAPQPTSILRPITQSLSPTSSTYTQLPLRLIAPTVVSSTQPSMTASVSTS